MSKIGADIYSNLACSLFSRKKSKAQDGWVGGCMDELYFLIKSFCNYICVVKIRPGVNFINQFLHFKRQYFWTYNSSLDGTFFLHFIRWYTIIRCTLIKCQKWLTHQFFLILSVKQLQKKNSNIYRKFSTDRGRSALKFWSSLFKEWLLEESKVVFTFCRNIYGNYFSPCIFGSFSSSFLSIQTASYLVSL